MTVVQAKRMGFSELGKDGFAPNSAVDDEDDEEDDEEEEEPKPSKGKLARAPARGSECTVTVHVEARAQSPPNTPLDSTRAPGP